MKEKSALKSTVFKVAQARVDHHKNVVMVDMLDKDYNKLGFHKSADNRFAFDAFYLKERLLGEIDSNIEIKTIYGVIDFLKTQGISMVYTGEFEK